MKSKKSLGQNFLNSPKIIGDIVSAGKVKKGDVVLEIGPGEGTMTSVLLKTDARVVAVEKDDRLIPILQEKFAKEISSKQLRLIHTDILECNLDEIIKRPYKVVANIPYYITGQIIRKFLENDNQPISMTILVQKEVAERIIAKDKKENLLSLSVKIYGGPRLVRFVGRGAFSPQPNVDSAVLNVENISKKRLVGADEKKFFKIIHTGFAHKRKQLVPNLSSLYKKEKLIAVFETIGLNKKIRAEDVLLEEWVQLCKTL